MGGTGLVWDSQPDGPRAACGKLEMGKALVLIRYLGLATKS